MNWNLDNFENQHIYKGNGRALKPCIQKSGKLAGKMIRVDYLQTCPPDSAANADINKMFKHQSHHKCQHQICLSCHQVIKYQNLKNVKNVKYPNLNISKMTNLKNVRNPKDLKHLKTSQK